jgi:signal transduction histidine kinase
VTRAVHALIANALIYGLNSAPVDVAVLPDSDRVRMRVTGGGPGPDEDEEQHLFERFYRGKSAADAGQAGSGLGLFVARGIARRHGGDVRRVAGDLFELELPL